jgi:hypothetical protein
MKNLSSKSVFPDETVSISYVVANEPFSHVSAFTTICTPVTAESVAVS